MDKKMLGLIETIVVSLPGPDREKVDRTALIAYLEQEKEHGPDAPMSLLWKGMVYVRRMRAR